MALHASRFGLADQRRNVWQTTVPAGTTFNDLLDPGYWAHVAAKLRPGDIVQARDEPFNWYGEMIVRDSGHLFATMEEIFHREFGSPEQAANDIPTDLLVEWGGRAHQHRVYRVRDGRKEVIQHGFETKEKAIEARAALALRMAKKAA